MTAVHQFVPAFEPGAVGTHILEIQRALGEAGWESEVFADIIRPGFGHARPYADYGSSVPARPGDVLLYHVAIGSPVASFLLERPERKALDHHNITPAEFFERWEPNLVHGLHWGRQQLADLAPSVDFALADSAFNRAELTALGCRRSAVVPILLDTDVFDRDPDPETLARLRSDKDDGGTDLLFVGRVSPNKCQHDLVKVLAAFRRAHDPRARLRIVGASACDPYTDALRRYAAALGLAEAVDLAGAVPAGVLNAYYRCADVFVSASEHEGFCVPLLEAWYHDLPVVAYSAGAVPETMRDAGVVLPAKQAEIFATAVDRVRRQGPLREVLVAAARLRLDDFALVRTRRLLVDVLRGWIEAA